MAKIVFIPSVTPGHSCVDEVHEVEKKYYTDNPNTMFLPEGTIVMCSCDKSYVLTANGRRRHESQSFFRSFFIGNPLFWSLTEIKGD